MSSILYSHIFLAVCATAMTAETMMTFDLCGEGKMLYLAIVFFSTLLVYNIKGVMLITYFRKEVISEKLKWATENEKKILAEVFISTVFLLIASYYISYKTILYLLPFGLLSIAYSIVVRISKYKISLREIPFLKTILVAAVWTFVVAYFPFVLFRVVIRLDVFWLISEFMFLFSLSILFDIKDIQIDKTNATITFPLVIGVSRTIVLSFLFMTGRILFLFFSRISFSSLMTEITISIIATFFIFSLLKKSREEKYYMLWIDGLMVGKFLLFLLFQKII
jgi:4-hydroxybenzoate polyprenyltransferase